LVCRDYDLFHQLTTHAFGNPNQHLKADVKPTVLLYPEDYWQFWHDTPAWPVMEEAVQQLERYLGERRRRVNLSEKWLQSDPSGGGAPIERYLRDVKYQRR